MTPRLSLCKALAAALAFGLASAPTLARADVSSWLFVGTGPSFIKMNSEEDLEQQMVLQLDTGMGTPPEHAVIVGGLFRMQTHFGRGTDLGLALRTATHGFVNGDWGAAVDLGGYQRWWEEGSTGVAGSLALGGPWGITLSGTAGRDAGDVEHYSVVLGVDLARLTVYRRTGERWWKNPFPAYRPEEERR